MPRAESLRRMSGTVASVAAPDEADVEVSGGETPSGGTLRRLLSREGSPLFGPRPNGSLAPPLSVPVDPLLAGPPMDTTYERESAERQTGNGTWTRTHDDVDFEDDLADYHGNGSGGNGSTPTDIDDDADLVADEVGERTVDSRAADGTPSAGTSVADGERTVDSRAADGIPSAGTSVADDEPFGATEALVAVADPSGSVAEDIDARTAPAALVEPLTEPVDFADPPATVAVPALMPAPVETDQPAVEAPVARPAVPPPPRRRRTRPRVRKVTRIVRYIDAWSVFKVALLLNAVVAAVMVTASVLLWNLAYSTDVIDNVEGVVEDWLAYETFAFDGSAMFRAVVILAGLFVIAATGLAVLAATLFNLISDLTGGVKVTVLEREVIASPPPGARKVRGGAARRAAIRRAAAASAASSGPPSGEPPTTDPTLNGPR
jgi:hypothetical protein